MDTANLKAQYASLIAQAKALAPASGEVSEETAGKINTLLGQADAVKAQLEMFNRVAEGEKFLKDPADAPVSHNGWRNAGPGEGAEKIDEKSFREFAIPVLTPFGVEQKTFRYHVPLKVQGKGYADAYEAYIRRGKSDMGPQDLKALSEGLDASGGYTVPPDWQASVIKKIATLAVVRQYARVISTSRDQVKWPRVKYTTNNQYTSGIRLTWTGEVPAASTTARVTDQVFGEFNIPVATAMASQLVSNDLIDDSAFDILGMSADLFGEAFALGEEDVFWTGSGANQPRGIITDASDTTNFDAAGVLTNLTAGAITADEIVQVIYALPAQYERNARMFLTKASEMAIRQLVDTDGNFIWPVNALVGGLGPAAAQLLGFPVSRAEFMQNTSATTATYPLVFGDLSGYAVVDRVGLSIQRFSEVYAETNQVLLLGKKRVGGQLLEAYRLSLFKTVST